MSDTSVSVGMAEMVGEASAAGLGASDHADAVSGGGESVLAAGRGAFERADAPSDGGQSVSATVRGALEIGRAHV